MQNSSQPKKKTKKHLLVPDYKSEIAEGERCVTMQPSYYLPTWHRTVLRECMFCHETAVALDRFMHYQMYVIL
jgi:hypothetical protein